MPAKIGEISGLGVPAMGRTWNCGAAATEALKVRAEGMSRAGGETDRYGRTVGTARPNIYNPSSHFRITQITRLLPMRCPRNVIYQSRRIASKDHTMPPHYGHSYASGDCQDHSQRGCPRTKGRSCAKAACSPRRQHFLDRDAPPKRVAQNARLLSPHHRRDGSNLPESNPQ